MKKKGRFFYVRSKYILHEILKVKGTIHGRDIIIVVCPLNKENYIDVDIANQLQIPESSIEKIKLWNKDQINNLSLRIDNYIFVSQFIVKSIDLEDVDIVLGFDWMETLGTFFLNAQNKFLTFFYKKKRITL
jgi:hypothetical protein